MQRIDFYFDPVCPFCWITSRWLVQVSEERDLEITWRPFSLAIKNGELGQEDSGMARSHNAGHRIHRVIAAAAEQGASRLDLYTAFGHAYHVEGRDYDDVLVREVLKAQGLDESQIDSLAAAAQDTSWDQYLSEETDAAVAAVGDDTGVPVIAFEDEQGNKRGYFGPVLNAMPSKEEGLAIWDGLSKLAPVTSFYELKRTRPDGMPDTASTKGL